MKKRLISLLLACVMVLSLAACSNNTPVDETTKETEAPTAGEVVQTTEAPTEAEPKDPVTIVYYYDNNAGEQQYTGQVEEKLNEILKGIEGYEHISIDLVPCKDYVTDFALAQSSGKQIDLVSTYMLDTVGHVADGDFIPLEDLLEKYPNVVSEVPDWIVEMGKVHGGQYLIPTYQQACNLQFLLLPTEYLNMYLSEENKTEEEVAEIISSGDVAQVMQFMEDLCLAVRKGTGLETKYIYPAATSAVWSRYLYNEEFVDANDGPWILKEGAENPEYFGLSEDFKLIQQYFNKWYKEGLLHPEYSTIKTSDYIGKNYANDVSYVCAYAQNTCSEEYLEEFYTNKYGMEMSAFRTTDHPYIPSKYAAGGNAIYADSEHPEEAMMIIELLMTKKGTEFYSTLVFGLEGIHWEWEDKANNRIKTLEYDGSQGDSASTHHAYKWNIGNTFNVYKNQAVQDGYNEYIINEIHEGKDTVTSPAMGITWDLTSVADQVAQCKAVEKEYSRNIFATDDWEARYEEYVNKLEAAGIQDVIDCLEEQYQAHLASK